MSAPTLTPILKAAVASIPPKTVASTLVMAPIPTYWVTVAACALGDDGEPAWIRSERFQIQQLTPTLTIVSGVQFDEHGFELCPSCREHAGSEWCCGYSRDFDQVISYMRHYRRVHCIGVQRTAEQIAVECPVNVYVRGPVAA